MLVGLLQITNMEDTLNEEKTILKTLNKNISEKKVTIGVHANNVAQLEGQFWIFTKLWGEMSIWALSHNFKMIFGHTFNQFVALVKHNSTNLTSLIAIFDKNWN